MENQTTGGPVAGSDLAAHLVTRGWSPEEWARTLLRCSGAKITELLHSGEINGLHVGGQLLVERASVTARIARQADDEILISQEQREAATTALRAYLSEHEVTGSWELCMQEARPLISSRRGDPKRFRAGGIDFHSVVLSATKLFDWVTRTHGDLAVALPSAVRLHQLLVALPGIEPVAWVTALDEPGHPHRLTRWIKVDPATWPVKLSRSVEEAIAAPTGRDVVEELADGIRA